MRRTPPQLQPAIMAIVWVERPAAGACSEAACDKMCETRWCVTNRVKRGGV